MSAAVALRRAEPERRLSLFEDVASGERTLADCLAGIWEGLSATGRAACPICGATMIAAQRMGAARTTGRCGGCGSELS